MELRNKITEMEDELSSNLGKMRNLESMKDNLERELQNTQVKLKESAEVIKSNQNVILYLNQLVNTEQIGGYTPVLDSQAKISTPAEKDREKLKRSPDTVTKFSDTPPNAVKPVEDEAVLKGMQYLGLGDTPGKLKVSYSCSVLRSYDAYLPIGAWDWSSGGFHWPGLLQNRKSCASGSVKSGQAITLFLAGT